MAIYLIDKQSSWTSRDVVNKMTGILSTRKVGHTGTLDPFATGLLIVTADLSTKCAPFLDHLPKTYRATLTFGIQTSTGDCDGELLAKIDKDPIDLSEIKAVMQRFIGKQMQTPPATSAKKKDGVAYYKLAHKGLNIRPDPVEIEIYQLSIVEYKYPLLTFDVQCSTGTYVRTLGEDIAAQLNTVGHLSALRRLAIGHFHVDKAKTLTEVKKDDGITTAQALAFMPTEVVGLSMTADVKNGKQLQLNRTESPLLIVDQQGEALAVYQYDDETKRYYSKRGLF